MRTVAPVLTLVLAALVGCERPFVAMEPPRIEVESPDLSDVLTDDQLVLSLRVTALAGIEQVEVNGERITRALGSVFTDTLTLAEGLNRVVVDALDEAGNASTDTLFAVYLPIATANLLSAALPEPRADHAAALLPNSRVLVAGGVDRDARPSASAFLIREVSPLSFAYDVEATGALAEARTGHTLSALPDGRVLAVGGARTNEPLAASEFVTSAEVYDSATGTFTPLALGGEPVRRAFHTATVLTDASRTFVYLYGGRGPLGNAIGTRSDVTVLELRAGVDSLINLSPGGAIGAFAPLARHVQLPLPLDAGSARTLVAGTYVPPEGGDRADVAFRFLYTPSSFFFPFEFFEETVASLRTPRTAHAGALLRPGLALFAGGLSPEGTTLGSLEVFADEASRFFQFPDSRALRTRRQRHTATLLPSGRILLLGGLDAAGTTLASAELILPSSP